MNKNSSSSSVWIYIILGFVFGLVIVALATVVALISAPLAFTLQNVLDVHLSNPLMWIIDSFPFFLAAVVGLLGSREGQVQRMRMEGRETQKRAAEVGRLNAELAKKDQERQEIEAVISRGKKEWEATFDSVVDMILLVDENGKIIRCNHAAANAFQLDFPQIIGTQIDERFFGSETGDQMPSMKTEMKFPELDGWYEVSSDPLTFQEGVQQGRIYLIRNITDRKQAALDLERQKQFYESLVKNSPVGIVTLSLDHRVVACNPAFEKMFGYRQQEVIGQNIDSLISPSELIDESLLMTYNVSQGEVVRKITKRRSKDGSLVDVELFGIPVVLWGKQIGILGMYHNVSDLVRAGQPVDVGEAAVEGGEAAALGAAALAVGAAVSAEPEVEEEAEIASPEAEAEPAITRAAEYAFTEPAAESALEAQAEIAVTEGEVELQPIEAAGEGVTRILEPAFESEAEAAASVMEPEALEAEGEEAVETAAQAFESEAVTAALVMEPEALEAAGEDAVETAAQVVEPETLETEQARVVAPFTDLDEAGLEVKEAAVGRPRRRSIKINTIEGIGPVHAAMLGEYGLFTTEDLLTAGATRKGRQELVEKTGISDTLILRWVNKADLMRVPGVGEEYSDLLEAAGVDTVKELRSRNPSHLYNALVEANAEKHLVRRPPYYSEVENWVEAAKEIESRVSY